MRERERESIGMKTEETIARSTYLAASMPRVLSISITWFDTALKPSMPGVARKHKQREER